MPYRMRVFARNPGSVEVSELRAQIDTGRFDLAAAPDANNWQELVLRHKAGEEIALIERDDVAEGTLGFDELQEFIEETDSIKPGSAASWLKNELPKVRVIFAFQVLHGTDVKDGWDPLHKLFSFLRHMGNGFSQADLEGFSNDDGYQITWGFNDRVSGQWNMALLQNGKWVAFEMELANRQQRAEFMQGQLPTGAKLL